MPYQRRVKGCLTLLRNLVLAGVLYACIFGVAQTIRKNKAPSEIFVAHERLFQEAPDVKQINDTDPKVLQRTRGAVRVKFAGLLHPVTINPYANVFNRPSSAVVPMDDYLGPRMHVDTEAYYPKIIDACRGDEWRAERMPLVAQCLHYLAFKEGDYTRIPAPKKRASARDPREAEYLNADDHNNTLTSYVDPEDAVPPSVHSHGTCAGPIIPYHTYWRGSPTWRLELFIKSFYFTQNIPCSRLYVWMDEDESPGLVNRALRESPIFKRFLPLVDRGDLIVRPWTFPSRVAMPSSTSQGARSEAKVDGERIRFDRVTTPRPSKTESKAAGKPKKQLWQATPSSDPQPVEQPDAKQDWLEFSAKQLSLLPSPPKEAIRWILLHQHGGVFLDSDVLMLRDLRPLVLPANHSFAQRWGSLTPGGEYGTSVTSLRANSSLSSYFLRGGVRMGMNFHPLVLGTMARKDGRNQDMVMLENTIFDPLWRGNGKKIRGRCQTPCLEGNEWKVFQGRNNSVFNEWRGFAGSYKRRPRTIRKTLGQLAEQFVFSSHLGSKLSDTLGSKFRSLPAKDDTTPADDDDDEFDHSLDGPADIDFDDAFDESSESVDFTDELESDDALDAKEILNSLDSLPSAFGGDSSAALPGETSQSDIRSGSLKKRQPVGGADKKPQLSPLQIDAETFSTNSSEDELLRKLGITGSYDASEDIYPPTNRTLQHFFRGAYTYNIHAQWDRHPEPSSWLDVIRHAHDGFFEGRRTNPYGEQWTGPDVDNYGRWMEFL